MALILAELYKNLMLFREGQCGKKVTKSHGLDFLRSEIFKITDALENCYLHYNTGISQMLE